MSNEHFKIIIEKAKKNVEKYKIFKENDINYISSNLHKYAKLNNVILFGNYAFNKQFSKNKVYLYDSVPESKYNFIASPDLSYCIYSSNIIKDLINITNILNKKFKYIKAYSSFNEFEYIVEINFKAIIKIYYCPSDIYKLFKSKNSLLEPKYMLLNILDKLITPISSSYLWYFHTKQFNIIINNLKITKPKQILFNNNLDSIKEEIIKKILVYNKKIILLGDVAYKLINNINVKENIGVIEIMTCCMLEELNNIFKYLFNKYKIKYKKINKFFIYFSDYYEIYIDNILILKIYSIDKNYNYLNINSYQVLNIQGQLLFLLNKVLELSYLNKNTSHYEDMINNYLYFYKKKEINYQILQTNIINKLDLNKENIKNISYNPTGLTDFQKKDIKNKLNKIKFPDLTPQLIIEKEIMI